MKIAQMDRWQAGGTAAAMAAAFLPLFRWMSQRYLEANSFYTHGFLMPVLVAYLVWRRRARLAAIPLAPSNAGLALVAAGLAGYLGGLVFRAGFVGGLALIVVLAGTVLYLAGVRMLRALLAPLVLVLLMIPLPQALLIGISFKLKMLAASLAGVLARCLSVPVERAGSIIYLPQGTFVVENECSGISSLMALCTVSVLLACLSGDGTARKALIVFSAVPIAIIANALRIVFLILAAYVYGVPAVAQGVVHYGAGAVLWGAALALFFLLWGRPAWDD
jgi:exosortase